MTAAPVLTVARWTLLEAVRRRLVLTGAALSAAFLALYTVGFVALDRVVESETGPNAGDLVADAQGMVLTILGLYAIQFMASFLALLLSTSAVSLEADSGALHAVLARPVSRVQYLAGRMLALTGVLTVYVVTMSGTVLLLARIVAGYRPMDPGRAVALMLLQALVLLAAGLLGSTMLQTLASGVLLFSLYGLAWLAGIIEVIGTELGNSTMVTVGIVVSLLFPSDAIWHGASYYAQTPVITALAAEGFPFASAVPPSAAMVVWSVAYALLALAAAAAVFRRRDL